MVQALINNNINTVKQGVNAFFTDTSSQMDFQKLFDKQTEIAEKQSSVQQDLNSQNSEEVKSDEENKKTEAQAENVTDEAETLEQCTNAVIQEAVAVTPIVANSNDQNNDQNNDGADVNNADAEINSADVEVNNSDDDLDVIINGKNLDSFFKEFNLNKTVNEGEIEVKLNRTDSEESADGASLEDIMDEEMLKELKIESVSAETSDSSNSSGGDILKQQTPQEQGVKAILQADTEFKEIKPESVVQKSVQTNSGQEMSSTKIIEQITKQMEGMYNGSKVNIVLNPESLGKVSVQLINTKEGLSAQFTVATQEARNLIVKGVDGLKETLLSHGFNVDNVSVKVSDAQESEYNADWTEQDGSNGGYKDQQTKKEHREAEEFEQNLSSAGNDNNQEEI